LAFSFAVAVLSFTLPLFMLLTYDRVLSARSIETLTALIVLTVICLTGMGALDFARRRALATFGSIFQEHVEGALLAQDRAAGLGRKDGLAEAGTAELDALRSFIHSGALLNVLDVLFLPLFAGVVFLLSPALGVVAVLGAAAIGLVCFVGRVLSRPGALRAEAARRRVRDLVGRHRRTNGRLAGQNLTDAYLRFWQGARQTARRRSVHVHDHLAAYEACVVTLRSLTWVLMLATGAALVLDGLITAGVMIAAVVLVNRVLGPWVAFLRSLPTLASARRNWRRLGARMAQAGIVAASAPPPLVNAPLLELSGVTLSGPDGTAPILEGVDLSVRAGEAVVIQGKSGSGKTMLCELLALARNADAGEVRSRGRHAAALDEAARATFVGYVSEDHVFAPATISENISSLVSDRVTAEVERAAQAAGLHAAVARLPRGYATRVDEHGLPLPSGLRERLALARALFHRPRLLVIDAPSALLWDQLARESVEGASRGFLTRRNALVVATRDASAVPFPVMHYELTAGRLTRLPDASGIGVPRLVSGIPAEAT
jgi:ATP-binding cassette subfamily C protein